MDVLVYGGKTVETLSSGSARWHLYDSRNTYENANGAYIPVNSGWYSLDSYDGHSEYRQRSAVHLFLDHPDFAHLFYNNAINITQPSLDLGSAIFQSSHNELNYKFTSETQSQLTFSTLGSYGEAAVQFTGNLRVRGEVGATHYFAGSHNRFDFHDSVAFNGNVHGMATRFYISSSGDPQTTQETPSRLRFYDDSSMATGYRISAGEQEFHNRSTLFLTGNDYRFGGATLIGGHRTFNDQSTLRVISSGGYNAVFSPRGSTRFYDQSQLILSSGEAFVDAAPTSGDYGILSEDINSFFSWESYGASAIQFYDQSSAIINGARSVNAGLMHFSGDSSLQANVAEAIIGGSQSFQDTATLRVNTTGAITGGTQTFQDGGRLHLVASNSITGGEQTFGSGSRLDIDGVPPKFDPPVMRELVELWG